MILIYMLAIRAAPPNRAPMPMAAVWTGPAFVALDWAELAAPAAELALEAPALLRLAILEEREAAAEPVAVDSCEDREAMPEPTSEVIDAMLELAWPSMEEARLEAAEAAEEASLSIDEIPLATAPVAVAETVGAVKS